MLAPVLLGVSELIPWIDGSIAMSAEHLGIASSSQASGEASRNCLSSLGIVHFRANRGLAEPKGIAAERLAKRVAMA